MKKLRSKTLGILINELNRLMHKWENYQKKDICITKIDKVEIFYVVYNKVALLTRRLSEMGTRNCHQIIFRKVWAIYLEMLIKKNFLYDSDSDEIEIRLFFWQFSQNFGTYLVVFVLRFCIHGHRVRVT